MLVTSETMFSSQGLNIISRERMQGRKGKNGSRNHQNVKYYRKKKKTRHP